MSSSRQELVESRIADGENQKYLTEQLITYLGNKRALLGHIGLALTRVKAGLGREKLAIFDVFSGSGAASRFFKQHASRLIVNDLEKYAQTISRCYLANKSEINISALRQAHEELSLCLRSEALREGFIHELYAPKDDTRILPGERVFYTSRNAKFLDTARDAIERIDPELRDFFIAPLLSEASIHANTSGVFKGFYKDRDTGLGKFGGKNADALSRITGEMTLPFPIFSDFECEVEIYREDSNLISRQLRDIDLAYVDPPYNQHPYGSNYFMLNLLVDYRRPESLSPVSGIPRDWNRSRYNSARHAERAFADLLQNIDARYLLVSFNSEGFLDRETMLAMLKRIGSVELFETKYNTFRGSRNLGGRSIHVREYLYLVKK